MLCGCCIQEKVTGVVVVTSKGSMSHSGIKLFVEGSVSLQLSARSIGLFEAFYSSLKPVSLLSQEIEVSAGGKLPDGVTELPFEFVLRANAGEELFDTYHGVYVTIQYMITCDMQRYTNTYILVHIPYGCLSMLYIVYFCCAFCGVYMSFFCMLHILLLCICLVV